jgi:hypothetical protein
VPTIFETINQRATNIKAARWQAYTPLTALQLTDYDMVADEPAQPDPDPMPDWVTLITPLADPSPPVRSTRHSAQKYKQFIVLKRPTEAAAVSHAQGAFVLDGDYAPVKCKRPRAKRWCIYCKDRHPVASFVKETGYLHGLSYACKTARQEQKRQGWYYASLKERASLDSKIVLRNNPVIGR